MDKNFEKYSDAVRAQAPERIDAIIGERTVQRRSSEDAAKKSSLQMNVVKTEDPLVAFKVSFFLPIYFSSSRLWTVWIIRSFLVYEIIWEKISSYLALMPLTMGYELSKLPDFVFLILFSGKCQK